MSHVLIQQLRLVQEEFEAARVSLDYLTLHWSDWQPGAGSSVVKLNHVQRAASTLQMTYTIRAFSAFEAILRDFLPPRRTARLDRRSVYDLINRAASRQRIPASIRDDVHQVREYRNQAVHQGKAPAQVVLFRQALSALYRFLAWLP